MSGIYSIHLSLQNFILGLILLSKPQATSHTLLESIWDMNYEYIFSQCFQSLYQAEFTLCVLFRRG